MPEIVYDEFTTIRDDIERVQKKPTMYISWTGPEAVLHLSKEITNNAIDEHSNPNSVSDGVVNVFYDAMSRTMTIEDHGRGIAFDELYNACTVLQSGTKMDRLTGGTAGENGVGLTVTNALSDLFEITSTNGTEAKCLQFRNGELSSERMIPVRTKGKHGLVVTFCPSKYFLGNDATLPYEEYFAWLHKLSFFMNPQLDIRVTVDGLPGKAAAIKKVFKNTSGIAGFIPEIAPDADLMAKPISLVGETKLVEKDVPIWEPGEDGDKIRKLVDLNRFIRIEFSFNYCPAGDTRYFAFCNDIENIEGGEHEDAVRAGIQSVIMKMVNETKKKNEKIEVLQRDVLTGLNVVLNLRTDVSTKFTGQTKYKLGNKALYDPVRKLVVTALTEFLRAPENNRYLTKIVEIVKTNAKLRTEESKKRSNIKRESLTVMDSKVIVGYQPANFINRDLIPNGQSAQLEIAIVEGDSAGGNARRARWNQDVQGILAMKGKPPNVYAVKTKDLARTDGKKDNFYVIFFNNILGCGYGDNYREENLIYDKILMIPDADVDGHHIAGLLLSAIVKHCPQLIENGHVYRVVAPLYRLRHKGDAINVRDYLYEKPELYTRFEHNVSEFLKLKIPGANDYLTSDQLAKFLETNREFYETLQNVSGYHRMHPDIIEYIVFHMKDYTKKGVMEKLDPEMHYNKDGDSITGCYQTQRYSMILDHSLRETINYLYTIYHDYNNGIGSLELYNKKGRQIDLVGTFTIGQIMERCMKYYPDVSARYKGLGEMTPVEMKELIMNPHKRKLLRFTIEDMEYLTEQFDNLFLDGQKYRTYRKHMVETAKISIDDIDN